MSKEFDDTKIGPSDENEVYSARLTRHILRLLYQKPRPLDFIFSHSEGSFPSEVLSILDSLRVSGRTKVLEDTYGLSEEVHHMVTGPDRIEEPKDAEEFSSSFDFPMSIQLVDKYPEPHPAEYDWRFTKETVRRIARQLIWNGANQSVALLGTPSLFPILAENCSLVTLFDKSRAMIEYLKGGAFKGNLIEQDLFLPLEVAVPAFDFAVADPPWYTEFYKAFIFRSSEILKQDGLLYLSMLPWLTRPTAVDDRIEIVQFARDCGFDLIEAGPSSLQYVTPLFEKVGFELKGLNCGNWRRGDLFVFRRVEAATEFLHVPKLVDEPEWDEFRIGNRRVKVKKKPMQEELIFTVKQVGENGKFFDSVSRRATLRSQIDVWTSDNVAFSVTRLDLLTSALSQIASGVPLSDVISEKTPKLAVTQNERQDLIKLIEELASPLAANR